MYDDYDLEYCFGNDNILDEDMYYEYNHQQDDMMDLDEDYDRDTQDFQALAYHHYAWYNNQTSNLVLMVAQKRQVQVTLDVECYDDLDLENLDWNTLLNLEGDEKVHYVKIKEHEVFCWWKLGLFDQGWPTP